MRKFHPLTIKEIRPETRDSVRISFDIPEELRDDYSFIPGQHLPFEIQLDGKKLRRTYSICSAQGQPLEIGIRVVRALDVRPEKAGEGDDLARGRELGVTTGGRRRTEPDLHRVRILAKKLRYLAFSFSSSIQDRLVNVAVCFETSTFGGGTKDFYMSLQKIHIQND